MTGAAEGRRRELRRLARAVALSLGPAIALGMARFGYALVLPAMREDLGWSYAQAGSMNTANALGYLLGAVLAAPVARAFGLAGAFRATLLATILALGLSGLTDSFVALLVLRGVAGAGGAVVFIAGAALASHLAARGGGSAGRVVGTYFGGVGLGILATGLGLPALLEVDAGLWRVAWLLMAGAGVLAFWPAARAAGLPSGDAPPPGGEEGAFRLRRLGVLAPTLVAYFLFGLGYIAYMTFIIAFLQNGGSSPLELSLFWGVLGVATASSGFVWGRPFDRLPGGRALALVLAIVAAGAALPLLSRADPAVLASGLLFGSSFLGVVGAVTMILRQHLPAAVWTAAIAFMTVVFSLGQTLGPILAGGLADRFGGLEPGLTLSAGFLALGAGLALLQREPAKAS